MKLKNVSVALWQGSNPNETRGLIQITIPKGIDCEITETIRKKAEAAIKQLLEDDILMDDTFFWDGITFAKSRVK